MSNQASQQCLAEVELVALRRVVPRSAVRKKGSIPLKLGQQAAR